MKWYLTQQAMGEPELDVREPDEDLTLGYSLLREMARSDSTLVEIGRGMWWQSKITEDE